jgi:hypothetical protein
VSDAEISLAPGTDVPGLRSPYRHERDAEGTHADHVETAAHETRADLLWTDHGDRPYWTLASAFMSFDEGSHSVEIELPTWRDPTETRTWSVTLSYHHSGLEPRPSDDVEQLYEFDLTAYAEEERKLPLIIQPRLGWQTCPDRRPQSVPDDLGEATNVRVNNAVNLELDQIRYLIPLLLKALHEALGESWNDSFLTGEPHHYSSIHQHERYLRVDRDEGQKLTRSDGTFRRLFDLLAGREGSKVVYSADDREAVGWNHQVRLSRGAAREAFDGTGVGGLEAVGHQLKLYRPKHVGDRDPDDPLAHPKLGALFKSGLNGGEAVRWHDRHELVQALETYELNVLSWSGIAVSPGPWFKSDWHFTGDRFAHEQRQVTLVDDPLPEIETRQESRIVSALTALQETDRDVLEAVVATDGGTPVAEIEETTGWSSSTVYRALTRLSSLLENDSGRVSFISGKIRDECREILGRLDRAVDAGAAALERILGMDGRDMDRKGKAWQKWVNKYAAELVERVGRSDELHLRSVLAAAKSDSFPNPSEVLDAAKSAWTASGRPPGAFPDRVVYESARGESRNLPIHDVIHGGAFANPPP